MPKNPLDMSPEAQKKGWDFIQSGIVSPEEIARKAQELGFPQGAPTGGLNLGFNMPAMNQAPSMPTAQAPPQEASPISMAAPRPNRNFSSNEHNNLKKGSQTEQLRMDIPTMGQELQDTLQLPFMQEYDKGLANLQKEYDTLKAQPSGSDFSWVKPILALIDSQTGSKLTSGYSEPTKEKDRQALLLKYQDQITNKNTDRTKLLLDSLSKRRSGTDFTQWLEQQKLTSGTKPEASAGGGSFDEKAALRTHLQAMRAVNTQPVLKQQTIQLQNILNDLNILKNADKVTPSEFKRAQNGLRQNFGIKGTGGVDERKAQELRSAGIDVDSFVQYWTGLPQDIPKDDKLLRHIIDVSSIEADNVQSQLQSHLDALYNEAGWVYRDPRFSHLKKDMDNVIGILKQAGSPAGKHSGGSDINADLSKMNKEQLKAWLATHGG